MRPWRARGRAPPEQTGHAGGAVALLRLALDGADFAELATEHSDDPGSAQRGGSLGWFSRGRMVAPFEQAAFGTEPGKVVPEVVETQFGFHVIKVEDKRKRPFEELRGEIEEQLARPERMDAERAYVTRLMEDSHVEFVESNVDTLIALVDQGPDTQLTEEQRRLPLATYEGGGFELQEIWRLYRALPPSNQGMIAGLDQAGMIQALSQLMQRRILLDRARTRKTVLDSTRQRQLDEIDGAALCEQDLELGRQPHEHDPKRRKALPLRLRITRVRQGADGLQRRPQRVIVRQLLEQCAQPVAQGCVLGAEALGFCYALAPIALLRQQQRGDAAPGR